LGDIRYGINWHQEGPDHIGGKAERLGLRGTVYYT